MSKKKRSHSKEKTGNLVQKKKSESVKKSEEKELGIK